ncbi:Transcription initiation factor IIB family protein [Halanaeroarchaeum sp. HSR-CO]|uniref:transcription initiation factor IIB n=1 Tax=Halanaeroarchaeum sp. HSR-CO TaxID=2866382 RepID=UPI00217DA5E7|nr:transcription initiation factor IIB family protein [Halanaeroarchaeum sp. HSR-CO]UWG46498.1 Transcription initiation factor IIB family protein [Halanaeroarchaeum sp. HSR-CO]
MSATNANSCPECSGPLQTDQTETVCKQCGLVVAEDRIDHGPEWRSFSDGPNRERTGAPLTRSRHDRGLSTEIGRSSRLKGRKRRRVARMRTQHDRSRVSSTAERNQIYAFTEIRRLTGALSLPRSVRDQACVLFDSAQDDDLLRGRSLEGFAAATVYAVCRTNGLARTMGEIADAARAAERELQIAYDAMNRELGLQTGPIRPRTYLPRFASDLDLSAAVERDARSILEAGSRAVGGRNPGGVAAAGLYLAAEDTDEQITQAAAADAAGVSAVTVRSAIDALRD